MKIEKASLSSRNIKGSSASLEPSAYLKRFIPAATVSHGGLDVAWREKNKAADRKVSGSAAQGQQVVRGILQLGICKGTN